MSKINLTIKLSENNTIKRILSLNCTISNIDVFKTMITTNSALDKSDTSLDKSDTSLDKSDTSLKKNTFAYRNNLYQIPNNNTTYPKLNHFGGKMHIIIPFENSLEDIYLRLQADNKTKKINLDSDKKFETITAEHEVKSQNDLTNILNHYKFYADYSANTKLTTNTTAKPIEIKVNDIDINDFLQKEKNKLYKQFIKLKKHLYMDHKNQMIKNKLNNLDTKINYLNEYIKYENYETDKFKDF